MHDALPVALILLASAVAVVVLFRQISMPAILGYLIVGAIVGAVIGFIVSGGNPAGAVAGAVAGALVGAAIGSMF